MLHESPTDCASLVDTDIIDMDMDMVDMDMVDMVNRKFSVNFIYLGRLTRIISRTSLDSLVLLQENARLVNWKLDKSLNS